MSPTEVLRRRARDAAELAENGEAVDGYLLLADAVRELLRALDGDR